MERNFVITTSRLGIRRIAPDDWESVQRIWESQKKSEYAVYDRASDTAPDAVRERIAKWASARESTEHLFFAVCLGETVIGYAALNRRAIGYGLGYCFDSEYHGKGYAAESVKAVLEYAREKYGAAHFVAGTAILNVPSVRLLASLGFAQTGSETLSFHKDAAGQDICFEGGIFELDLSKPSRR